MCARALPTASIAASVSSTPTPFRATATTCSRVSDPPSISTGMPPSHRDPATCTTRSRVRSSGIPDRRIIVGDSSHVPALRQGLSVLRLLAGKAGPVTAGSVARELGLPRSTTYHLLAELAHAGFVTHLAEER